MYAYSELATANSQFKLRFNNRKSLPRHDRLSFNHHPTYTALAIKSSWHLCYNPAGNDAKNTARSYTPSITNYFSLCVFSSGCSKVVIPGLPSVFKFIRHRVSTTSGLPFKSQTRYALVPLSLLPFSNLHHSQFYCPLAR